MMDEMRALLSENENERSHFGGWCEKSKVYFDNQS